MTLSSASSPSPSFINVLRFSSALNILPFKPNDIFHFASVVSPSPPSVLRFPDALSTLSSKSNDAFHFSGVPSASSLDVLRGTNNGGAARVLSHRRHRTPVSGPSIVYAAGLLCTDFPARRACGRPSRASLGSLNQPNPFDRHE